MTKTTKASSKIIDCNLCPNVQRVIKVNPHGFDLGLRPKVKAKIKRKISERINKTLAK